MASGSDQLPFHHLLQISSDNYKQQMQDAMSKFNVFLTGNNDFFSMNFFALLVCDG